jgi:hypothetical protein
MARIQPHLPTKVRGTPIDTRDKPFFSSVNLGIHGQPWADTGLSAQSPEPPARAATLPLASMPVCPPR